jgi:hypothetical protein
MARKKYTIYSLIVDIIYCILLIVYYLVRLICKPLLSRSRVSQKVKIIEKEGPTIKVSPKTVANRVWSKVCKEDREAMNKTLESRSFFRLGVILALESVGTDPKMVECIAEQIEFKK